MKMKAPKRRTNTVTDYSSTDPKGIGLLPPQEQFPYLLAQLLEWSRSTQLHTVDVTLRMEPRWKYQFVVDGTAESLIQDGIKPDDIESAVDLSADPERRVKFQFELQKYVDHAISSTINLPAWDQSQNRVDEFAKIVRKYAHGLRGLTLYPDGSRGGQPITSVPYEEAHSKRGVVFEDNSEEQCLSCGI